MSDRSEVHGETAALVEALANGLYEEMFDPRCDTEGAVWDDAMTIARKVATRFEQVGWLQDADTDDPAPVKMKHGKAFYAGDVGVCVPIYRLSDAARSPE